MLRKYMAIVLFAAFSLVACDNGYDTRTGDAQTGTDPAASPDDMDDTEGASRERDMDTRTGGIRTRPGAGSEVDPDTGIDYGTSPGTNPGTGSIPEGGTSPGVGEPDAGTDDMGDTTGSP